MKRESLFILLLTLLGILGLLTAKITSLGLLKPITVVTFILLIIGGFMLSRKYTSDK